MMTLQEIFDKSAVHLLTQNEKSITKGGQCKYRGYAGKSCAVGCLISGQNYFEGLEGKAASCGDVEEALYNSDVIGDCPDDNTRSLLAALQHCHDRYLASYWYKALTEISVQYSLNTDAIKGFA